jgi:hypothetical protein
MTWWMMAVALAAEPTVSVDIVGPNGPFLGEEAALPYEGLGVDTSQGKPYAVHVTALPQDNGVLVYMSVGKGRGKGKVLFETTKLVAAGEIAEIIGTVEGSKKDADQLTFTVQTQWLIPYEAPAPLEEMPSGWTNWRHSVVWNDAALRSDVYADADSVVRQALDARIDPSQQASSYRVVGPEKAYAVAEVESIPSMLAPHCYDSAPTLRSYPFQYFIHTDDRLQVLTESVDVVFDDGTGLRFEAGVAALPAEGGGYVLSASGVSWTMDLPDAALGDVYRPAPHDPGDAAALRLDPVDGVLGQVNGVALPSSLGDWGIVARSGIREALVTARSGCVEVRAVVQGTQIREAATAEK